MKCIDEKELEIYVIKELNGETLSHSISNHISECNYCSNRINEMRLFYKEFINQVKQPVSQNEKNKVENLKNNQNPFTIETKFVNINSDPTAVFGHSVMHAETLRSELKTLFKNYTVLMSEDKNILIRIMKNIETGNLTLHLISEEESKYSNVIVKISSIDRDYITDKDGIVSLGKINLTHLESLKVFVRTPLSEFELTSLDSKNETILTNDAKDSIKIEFIPGELNQTLKVHLLKIKDYKNHGKLKIVCTKGNTTNSSMTSDKGIAVFHEFDKDKGVKIKVFG